MNTEIIIKKENALKAFNDADYNGKKLLENLLGLDALLPENIMERVRSYADACRELATDPEETLPYLSSTDNDLEISVNAYVKLLKVIEALNEDWIPDYRNFNQYKYYPWLKANPSGLGLSYRDYDYVDSTSGVGSRLCFRTSELARYAGQHFIELYADIMVIPATKEQKAGAEGE